MRRLAGSSLLASLALLGGCRQDMHNQPKFVPQRGTDFFADGRSVRQQVKHTVARGQLYETDFFYTGVQNGKEVDALPFPATMAVLERGQEQYNIYCTPCHSRVGNGAGMIVMRGYKPAGNFHTGRIIAEPLSHYFYVISNGYGAMPDYASQIAAADRWAIAAYIRALQMTQNAKSADVPAGARVQALGEVAAEQGLPASYAQPWEMPGTAVYAQTPTGNPGMAPPEPVSAPLEKNRPLLETPNGDPLPPSEADLASRIGRYGQKGTPAPALNAQGATQAESKAPPQNKPAAKPRGKQTR